MVSPISKPYVASLGVMSFISPMHEYTNTQVLFQVVQISVYFKLLFN